MARTGILECTTLFVLTTRRRRISMSSSASPRISLRSFQIPTSHGNKRRRHASENPLYLPITISEGCRPRSTDDGTRPYRHQLPHVLQSSRHCPKSPRKQRVHQRIVCSLPHRRRRTETQRSGLLHTAVLSDIKTLRAPARTLVYNKCAENGLYDVIEYTPEDAVARDKFVSTFYRHLVADLCIPIIALNENERHEQLCKLPAIAATVYIHLLNRECSQVYSRIAAKGSI